MSSSNTDPLATCGIKRRWGWSKTAFGLVQKGDKVAINQVINDFFANGLIGAARCAMALGTAGRDHHAWNRVGMLGSSLCTHLRAVLIRSHPLRTVPVYLLPAASASTWRSISSLSARTLPHRLGRQPLHKLLTVSSRENSTLQRESSLAAAQAEDIDTGHDSVASFDQFAGQAIREATTTSVTLPPPTNNPRLLLLDLFERLVQHGLLPQVSAEPPSSIFTGHESSWTVKISLPKWGVDVKGRGSNILYAEIAAAIHLDLMLRRPEYVTKLLSSPQTPVSCETAPDIIQSYWQFALSSSGGISRRTTQLESGAYEARIFAGSTQIGEPATSAVKDSARGIKNLTLAHGIATGYPDLWHANLQNPFQPRIVLDHARLEKLRHVMTAATAYLRTMHGHTSGEKPRGFCHMVVQEALDDDTDTAQKGESEAAIHRDVPNLDSWLEALPFPPSTAKMLILGASIKCLEPAILLAAVERHAVYRDMACRGEGEGGYRNPAVLNVMEGDHAGVISLFQRLRNQNWATKKIKGEEGHENPPKSSTGAQSEAKGEMTPDVNGVIGDGSELQSPQLSDLPESVQSEASEPVKSPPKTDVIVAQRFDHFDPDRIASVSATAREIERVMIGAGLVSHNKETSYVGAPGSELRVRAEPYGGSLSSNSHRRSMLRHLLVLGFSENIAQIGYGSLVPGQPPQLRINSQDVFIDSPLKAHMPMKQLSKTLRGGPLMVVTGATGNPEGMGLAARYCTPISTWQAVLLGKDLSLPAGSETPVADAAQLIVNKWLPVFVKSEVDGVSNEQARDTLLEARETLHRAIDKAMLDYVKFAWHSSDFYTLLRGLPNEDSFAAKEVPIEKRDAATNVSRRAHPIKHWRRLRDQKFEDTKS
ncbi:hypothetical protein diail_392 [Diaporthe ilicicola]|nr:hypothetical protein diail_392 [Diaporthe ilicicola]